jgi:hypothetical protein
MLKFIKMDEFRSLFVFISLILMHYEIIHHGVHGFHGMNSRILLIIGKKVL